MEHSYRLCSLALQATTILTQGVVTTLVRPILDAPVAAAQLMQPAGVGIVPGQARHAAGHFPYLFAIRDAHKVVLPAAYPPGKPPVRIFLEHAARPERAPFQPAMSLVGRSHRPKIVVA